MGASEVRVSPGMRKMLRAMNDMDMKKLGLWRPVINQFTAAVSENFEAEGRPSWPPLKTKYATKKHATFTLTGKQRKRPPARAARRHPILQLTQTLRKAATGTVAKGFRAVQSARTLIISIVGIPYAARHNFGYRGGQGRGRAPTPKRTFFMHPDGRPAMTDGEIREMNDTLAAQATNVFTQIKNSARI